MMTNKIKKCAQYDKTFSTNPDLKRHLQTHLENRVKFKCCFDQCSKVYCNRNNLKLHIKQFHLGTFKKLKCSFCESTFMNNVARNRHIVAIHTLEKPFKCKNCPSNFSSAYNLKRHQIVHTDERPHKCATCSKQFKKRDHLKRHMKTVHSTIKSRAFECSICNNTFTVKASLKRHSLTHRDDGCRFYCYFCKKEFIQRYNLEEHIRTHTQEKPFFCPVESCQFSCGSLSNLAGHTKTNHPLEGRTLSKTVTCYFCSKTIGSFQNLVSHLRIHTLEKPFTCGLCMKSFKNHGNLTDHISSHTQEKPYKCKECQKCFFKRYYLKHHVVSSHRVEKHL